MSQKEVIEKRRKEVADLILILRYPQREIAEKLKISRQTVTRDWKAIIKKLGEEYNEDKKSEAILSVLKQSEEHVREAWKCYRESGQNLKETREATKLYLDVLERLRLIDKVPDKVDLTMHDIIKMEYDESVKANERASKTSTKG